MIFKLQDDKISDYDKVPENIFLSFLEKLLGTVHLWRSQKSELFDPPPLTQNFLGKMYKIALTATKS